MDDEQVQSHTRSALKMIGTYLIANAIHDPNVAEAISGGIVAAIGLAWSTAVHSKPVI